MPQSDQTGKVDTKRCARCGRPTVADGTHATHEICWWSYGSPTNETDPDRSECERVTTERIATLATEVERLRYAHAEAMSLVSTASAELTRLRAELAHANELREHYYQSWRGVSGALMDASSVNAGDPQEVGVRELIAQRDRLRAVAEAARMYLDGFDLNDDDEAGMLREERLRAALAALEGT